MRPALGLLLVSGLALACSGQAERDERTGQLLVYVTTDAPLPPPPSQVLDASEAPPLFDRLRLELFAPSQTEAFSSRDFAIDREAVSQGNVSIGVVPPAGKTGYVARARLFRNLTLVAGEPPALSTVDVFAALPVVQAQGIVETTVTLRVEDLGQPQGSLSQPTQPSVGAPDVSRVGSWPGSERVPCSGSAGPGEACAPGGAFWMGNPRAGLHHVGTDASVTRLVSLRPFFVDLHEVTVAEFRASGLARLEAGSSSDPQLGHADAPPAATLLTPNDPQFFCTYSDAPLAGPASRENQPLTCASWTLADAYCKAQGKALPSEAQFEYLAGGLRSDLFVWGNDVSRCDGIPCCADSVWGRGGFLPGQSGNNSDCREPEDLGGPLPAGRGLLDRLALDGREVVDLVGNVSEWTRDAWNRSDEPCWSGRARLDSPECTTPSRRDLAEGGELHTVKGKSWAELVLPIAGRNYGEIPDPRVGFRCVRAAP